MRHDGAELLGVAPREVSRAANLLACGLDSMRVMELASRWRRHGVELRSADMLGTPRSMPRRGSYVRRRRVLGGRPLDAGQCSPPGTAAVRERVAFDLTPIQHADWVGRGDAQVLGGIAHLYCEFDGHGLEPGRLEQAVQATIRRTRCCARASLVPSPTWQIFNRRNCQIFAGVDRCPPASLDQ